MFFCITKNIHSLPCSSSSRKIFDFSRVAPTVHFDKGFGNIAAAAWYGGIWARHWFQRQSLYQNTEFILLHQIISFTVDYCKAKKSLEIILTNRQIFSDFVHLSHKSANYTEILRACLHILGKLHKNHL